MEFFYNGKKQSREVIEILSDFLDDNNLDLKDSELEYFTEMFQKQKFPKDYFKENLLNLDKIVEDKDILSDLIFKYSVNDGYDFI